MEGAKDETKNYISVEPSNNDKFEVRITFFGFALDCIIFSSGLNALIRGAKEGKISTSVEPSNAPGDKDNAACMGGIKFFSSVSNVGTFIFTDV